MGDRAADHNVFAILTSRDNKNKANSVIGLAENAKWFRKAVGGVAEKPTISSREPTPGPDQGDVQELQGAGHRLVITLDEALKNPARGFQFGTDPRCCDILLGHRGTAGISAKQYNIVVDQDLRIWLHDYHSKHGTALGCNGRNRTETKKKDTWILAFPPGKKPKIRSTVVHSHHLSIKIEFPNHAAAHPRYLTNLRAFAQKNLEASERIRDAGEAVGMLDLTSGPSTAAPSLPRTPGEFPVYYDGDIIGRGAFGVVRMVIKARDGKVYAAKTVHRPANKRKYEMDEPAWLIDVRREVSIMRNNPHANVVQLIDFSETPEPFIVMDYYPGGNMADANITDDSQYVSALGQVLDGLGHLHGKGVAHRDLKPENLLVETAPLFKVVIADFGLSKMVADPNLLYTFCGTLMYAAPEVFPGVAKGYGPVVDVWSLGVIAFEWLYGIPTTPSVPTPQNSESIVSQGQWQQWITAWSEKLLRRLDDEESDDLVDVLVGMIVVDPKDRWRSKYCLKQGFKSGLFVRRPADGLVVASSGLDRLALPGEGEDAICPQPAPP